jgi:hypothetical protein
VANGGQDALVVVKSQRSGRGDLWRVSVFVGGKKLIRPGFRKEKAAINLGAMLVQQMLAHGWSVNWKVFDSKGSEKRVNLAALSGRNGEGK